VAISEDDLVALIRQYLDELAEMRSHVDQLARVMTTYLEYQLRHAAQSSATVHSIRPEAPGELRAA
jgi:hypothetical protein